jgi:RimJ/RimL family protein N-acetyltransferase
MTYLVGKNIKLIKFTDRFVIPKYIDWLNNQDVNRYMCTGRIPISKEEVGNRNDYCNIMFAIMTHIVVENEDGEDLLTASDSFSQYIGTIAINAIDWINRRGEIGYMIGEQSYWGAGLATETVGLITDYALNRLNLHKVEAGVVAGNAGSIRVLEKNGFKEYAVVPEDYCIEGKYYDVHRFYKLQEW